MKPLTTQEFFELRQRITLPFGLKLVGCTTGKLWQIGNIVPFQRDKDTPSKVSAILVLQRNQDTVTGSPIDVTKIIRLQDIANMETLVGYIVASAFSVIHHELCERVLVDGKHAINPHETNGPWSNNTLDFFAVLNEYRKDKG